MYSRYLAFSLLIGVISLVTFASDALSQPNQTFGPHLYWIKSFVDNAPTFEEIKTGKPLPQALLAQLQNQINPKTPLVLINGFVPGTVLAPKDVVDCEDLTCANNPFFTSLLKNWNDFMKFYFKSNLSDRFVLLGFRSNTNNPAFEGGRVQDPNAKPEDRLVDVNGTPVLDNGQQLANLLQPFANYPQVLLAYSVGGLVGRNP